ncbi:phosphonate metabolism protein/1,5-bisphosphokinase (PRPP-forming) PhnN [Roseococcus sp. SDR]|uniref:phosphonate metabolism protein/1,5-bisphosphokinase (PRPP-forming) PhnN n=1 Tax=Roseococcus sp. SDR TaxID=2835532 RepID=UPI001BD05490|nr:phosphonate metabolism protein/1,5-bisphosphokinase (PRPP-forming) PhnN [Roseococcus sp. SDR]MBS7790507.1 phosphonate metabolism protein/1,5-bisphosphokinase (PRPP-forming) PhnN [Roseococcus sp. SDR]MBV1845821.1 phosphonate metabolism protein/1,5-bisphosphokinase (PRPP-forming) PhnN [Roseococcus sp. SDR]
MPSDLGAIAGFGQPGWVALAGPSGAGKDTLLDAVRAGLKGDPRFHFARRSITRPEVAGGEVHEALTPEGYETALAAGQFLLHWRAHGLGYGIRHEEAPADRVVVLSLSRAVLLQAAALRALTVIEVTAPPALLAARLAARGREDAGAIAARLAREVPLPDGLDMLRVINDGPVEQGAARLRSALEAVAAGCLPGGFRP